MKWGSFGAVHIATLAVGAAMIVGLYFALKNAPRKVQQWVLGHPVLIRHGGGGF